MKKLVYTALLVFMFLSCACRTVRTVDAGSAEVDEVASDQEISETVDVLEAAEAWFAEVSREPSRLPETQREEAQGLEDYGLTRIFADGPERYVAVFAPAGEPSRGGALHVVIVPGDEGGWRVERASWEAPRVLWPRM